MAEHPELWKEPTPDVAAQLDPLPTPGPELPEERPRERGPFVTYLLLPWSYGDRNSGERWHRLQCRRNRHEMGGGHTMQVGGTEVFVERRCRWCGTEPRDAVTPLR